jgi:lipopolysaccharide biosynthesis protein
MNEPTRLICFYLPQYHPIPENDSWWGKGFTDWTNVAKAKPVFPGHYQPHLPAGLGFYDLRLPEIREAQAALASEYGIFGFCYHHYWFAGQRLLDRPFNEVLASGKPEFPFCLCWANENWTRRWDGREHEVLIQQRHSDEDDINFIGALFGAFKDKRYIRVNDKPVLIVYRTDLLPDPRRTAIIWREEVQKAGLGDLYLCRAETFTTYNDYVDPETVGFDAAVEFPPHAAWSTGLCSTFVQRGSDFQGDVLDYEQVVFGSLMRTKPSYKLFRGVMPSWDNTPRKPKNGFVFINSSPELYQQWLADCIRWTTTHHQGDERLVFINAWNEWGEGCHLEPDCKYQYRYLQATRDAVGTESSLLRSLNTELTVSNELLSSTSIAEGFSRYASELLRTNMVLRFKLREQGVELPLMDAQQETSYLYIGEVRLSSFLSRYLRSNGAKLRRTRKIIYYILSSLWRTARRISEKLDSIELFKGGRPSTKLNKNRTG